MRARIVRLSPRGPGFSYLGEIMAKSIVVGTQTFSSKAAFLKAVGQLLQTAPLLKPLAGQDLDLAMMALAFHPRWDEITSPSFKHIIVIEHQGSGHKASRCFAVTYVNNVFNSTRQTFSYKPRPATAADAARAVVQPDILAFKDQRFAGKTTVPCEHCGNDLDPSEAAVHHDGIKFRVIVEECAFDPEDVASVRRPDAPYAVAEFKDPEMAKLVKELHDGLLAGGEMRLQIVCMPCNMKAERKTP